MSLFDNIKNYAYAVCVLINVLSQGLNIGTADKIYLEFPHKWWPEDTATFNLIWPEEDKEEFLQIYGQVRRYLCEYNYTSVCEHHTQFVLSVFLISPNIISE